MLQTPVYEMSGADASFASMSTLTVAPPSKPSAPAAASKRESASAALARPVALDLFAGAGGLSLGLEQAGFDVGASVEYDPVHAAAHKFNFPRTAVLCADVCSLSAQTVGAAIRRGLRSHGRDLETWDGQVDLVAGGPPCQGFSLIGKRLVDDTRNRLVFHFMRLVLAIRPRYFAMENVPGMATGDHASILDALIAEFEQAGYCFPTERKYSVLNAADFGVPQERHRLFLIGTRGDQPVVAQPPAPTVHPVPKRPKDAPDSLLDGADASENESERSVSDARASLPAGPTVWEAIGDLPNPNGFPSLVKSDAVKLSERRLAAVEAAASAYARRLRGIDADDDDFSYPRIWDRSLLTASMRTEHSDDSIGRFETTAYGETEPTSRFYRLHPRGLCNTLRAGSGSERGAFTSPRPLHPYRPRVLSNREAARLHSFPDWFRPHTTKWHGFRQIGNSVPPLLGRAVGARIVAALGYEPQRPNKPIGLGDLKFLSFSMSQAAQHFGADKASIPAPRTRPTGEAANSHRRSRSDRRRRGRTRTGIDATTNYGGKQMSKETRYAQMIERVFFENYEAGAHSVPFVRGQLETVAKRLNIALPKNLGDTLYSFRYRVGLPQEIVDCQPPGMEWAIFPDGRSKYRFVAVRLATITPRQGLPVTKIPDATPGMVELYSKYKDEQALLAKLRYNRLLDMHTGAVAYSLQNHLRTTIDEGQLETDELYVGMDSRGAHYAFPVQAKGGKDLLSIVQVWQDFKMCAKRFPKLIAQPVGAQFMADDVIALFSFEQVGDYGISIIPGGERHYQLVSPDELTDAEFVNYASRPSSAWNAIGQKRR